MGYLLVVVGERGDFLEFDTPKTSLEVHPVVVVVVGLFYTSPLGLGPLKASFRRGG